MRRPSRRFFIFQNSRDGRKARGTFALILDRFTWHLPLVRAQTDLVGRQQLILGPSYFLFIFGHLLFLFWSSSAVVVIITDGGAFVYQRNHGTAGNVSMCYCCAHQRDSLGECRRVLCRSAQSEIYTLLVSRSLTVGSITLPR